MSDVIPLTLKVTSEVFHCTTFVHRPLIALTHFRIVPDVSSCGLPVYLVADSTWSRHVRFGALSPRLSSTVTFLCHPDLSRSY